MIEVAEIIILLLELLYQLSEIWLSNVLPCCLINQWPEGQGFPVDVCIRSRFLFGRFVNLASLYPLLLLYLCYDCSCLV